MRKYTHQQSTSAQPTILHPPCCSRTLFRVLHLSYGIDLKTGINVARLLINGPKAQIMKMVIVRPGLEGDRCALFDWLLTFCKILNRKQSREVLPSSIPGVSKAHFMIFFGHQLTQSNVRMCLTSLLIFRIPFYFNTTEDIESNHYQQSVNFRVSA